MAQPNQIANKSNLSLKIYVNSFLSYAIFLCDVLSVYLINHIESKAQISHINSVMINIPKFILKVENSVAAIIGQIMLENEETICS